MSHASRCKKYRDANKGKIKQHWKIKYTEARQKLILLKAFPCMDCGGTFPPECMDFDHVRGPKVFNVAQCVTRSEKSMLDEISKCDLVCSNCHRIRTHKRRKGT